ETSHAESIPQGAGITFRGLKIGSITKVHVAKGGQMINIQINIENRFTWLIRTNTVFWRKVGVHAKLGLFDSEIKVNSLESIMSGGLELATPNPPGSMAKALQKFTLASKPPKDVNKWNPILD